MDTSDRVGVCVSCDSQACVCDSNFHRNSLGILHSAQSSLAVSRSLPFSTLFFFSTSLARSRALYCASQFQIARNANRSSIYICIPLHRANVSSSFYRTKKLQELSENFDCQSYVIQNYCLFFFFCIIFYLIQLRCSIIICVRAD